MAYFLGRDIKVAITTELTTGGVCIDTNDSNKVEYRTSGSYDANDDNFAGPAGDGDTAIFGTITDNGSVTYTNEVADLVGCDLILISFINFLSIGRKKLFLFLITSITGPAPNS